MQEKENKKKEFENILSEAIDHGLKILGETVKETLLFFIKNNFNLKEEEIPKEPEKFSLGLKKIYGEVGSAFLEDQILSSLYTMLGLRYTRRENINFEAQIREAFKEYVARL